ncbi:MAG: flagellar biosynthetic protein FliO [Betaproteobacteria bacterium]
MEILRIIGSLVLVFGLMGALLWGLKRMQTQMGQSLPGRRLQIVESVGVGPRQKIALVRVDGHEVLVGLSPGQMTALGQWPVSGEAAAAAEPEGQDGTGDLSYPMTAKALLDRESRSGT